MLTNVSNKHLPTKCFPTLPTRYFLTENVSCPDHFPAKRFLLIITPDTKRFLLQNLSFTKCFLLQIMIKLKKHSLIGQRNWVFTTNSNFLIPISLQSDGVDLWYFKIEIFWSNIMISLKYQRSTTLGCQDTGYRKSEFVAKTQFLLSNLIF